MRRFYKAATFGTFLLATSTIIAETGADAWLRYAPLGQKEAAGYGRLPATVIVLGDSTVLRSAQREMIRGVQGMLGRTLRGAAGEPGEESILLGTISALRAIAPSIHPPNELRGDGFWMTSGKVHGFDCIVIASESERGVLYATFAFLNRIALGKDVLKLKETQQPFAPVRWVDQWDNLDGRIERGYAGRSIFFDGGKVRDDLTRAGEYARLLASVGINGCAINNVNADPRVLQDAFLPQLARVAGVFRPWGVQLAIAVDLSSPKAIGGLDSFDPADPHVAEWWRKKADEIYRLIPDFAGFVVKADSEGRSGPATYGRTPADAANMIARALQPHGGLVFYRAFVYNHHLDWSDAKADRAKAAYDNFHPLDGMFDDNVIIQIKYGPIDFQVREPASPLFAGLEKTNEAIELQITQEYTGQQRHLCFLAPMWKEILDFDFHLETSKREAEHSPRRRGDTEKGSDHRAIGSSGHLVEPVAFPINRSPGVPRPPDVGGLGWSTDHPSTRSSVKDIVSGRTFHRPTGGFVGVANVGMDANWLAHPLAMANLYAFGRLAWDPDLSASTIAGEWTRLTFGSDAVVAQTIGAMLLSSWQVYESYTGPLGAGTLTNILGSHYGPGVESSERNGWGQWHRADHDGIGMDRSVATGTRYTAQYPDLVARQYEALSTTPDELLLFFHHVPYTYVLHSGKTVIQHIYDSHYEGADRAEQFVRQWKSLRGRIHIHIDDERYEAVLASLEYQAGHAVVWRDAICNWFRRASGIPDAKRRVGNYPNRIEAESMQLEGYTVVDVVPAETGSGGKAVECPPPAARCVARFRFDGSAGSYDMAIQYFDQNNGASKFSVAVKGELVDTWVAGDHLPATKIGGDASTRRWIPGVTLRTGDEIQIEGVPDGQEHAAFDYVEIQPAHVK